MRLHAPSPRSSGRSSYSAYTGVARASPLEVSLSQMSLSPYHPADLQPGREMLERNS